MARYKFYNSDNSVVAVSSFAGRTVRGTAKCNPGDTFSLESGKALAAARCNSKVAKKRVKCAEKKLNEAVTALKAATEHAQNMMHYHQNSVLKYNEAEKALAEILTKLA